MKIGIDIRALMEGKITGVQVYIINLLNAVFDIDNANEYVLFANSYDDVDSRVKLFDRPNVRYKIFRYPNKVFNFSQKYLSFPKIENLLGGIDLFYSPHWRSVAINAKIPVVVTFHDLSFELMPEFFTVKQRLWHKFMNYQNAALRARKIIAVSENTKNDLTEVYGIDSRKIDVIYPGIARVADSAHKTREKKYFLYFGTFEPRKNIKTLLAAYEEYFKRSKVKRPLVLAGSSGWKTSIRVPHYLKENITIYENVTERKKHELYARAFTCVFVSFYEGFGFPILEAAAAGVPVIAASSASLLEIGSRFSLFVNPLRSAQVTSAMLDLESQNTLYDSLQEKGRRAAEKFSWDTCAKQTLRLFNELI